MGFYYSTDLYLVRPGAATGAASAVRINGEDYTLVEKLVVYNGTGSAPGDRRLSAFIEDLCLRNLTLEFLAFHDICTRNPDALVFYAVGGFDTYGDGPMAQTSADSGIRGFKLENNSLPPESLVKIRKLVAFSKRATEIHANLKSKNMIQCTRMSAVHLTRLVISRDRETAMAVVQAMTDLIKILDDVEELCPEGQDLDLD